jgi:hypothetical protein
MEPEVRHCVHNSAPESAEFIPRHHTISLRYFLIISSHLHLGLP